MQTENVNLSVYVIYVHHVESSLNSIPVSIKSVHLTLEDATESLVKTAEEFCIAKMGSERFVRGQIEKPELAIQITDGYVLKKAKEEIEVTRRTVGYTWGYTETRVATLGIQKSEQPLQISMQVTKQELVDEVPLVRKCKSTQSTQTCPQKMLMNTISDDLKNAIQKRALRIQLLEERIEQGETKTELVVQHSPKEVLQVCTAILKTTEDVPAECIATIQPVEVFPESQKSDRFENTEAYEQLKNELDVILTDSNLIQLKDDEPPVPMALYVALESMSDAKSLL